MSRWVRTLILIGGLAGVFEFAVRAQEESGWRISPEKINIQVGEERPLQILDDTAQEIHGAEWSVDDSNLAEIHEEPQGAIVLNPKAVGTVRVSARLGEETRFRDIQIWPAEESLPQGTTRWSLHNVGRNIKTLPPVPNPSALDLYVLEQTQSGTTYLRAMTDTGIQAWRWILPEKTQNVDLVCGDWMGGALLSANYPDHFTLYTVSLDGTVRWQRTFAGVRKAHSYDLEHRVYILSQSPDRTVTKLTGLDEVSGNQVFELMVPASYEKRVNVRSAGKSIVCAVRSSVSPVSTGVSRLFVNIDGFAYLAFSEQTWELKAPNCTPGSVVVPGHVNQDREQRLVLWQIHPDGTYRSTVVEEARSSGPLNEHRRVVQPTGGIIPDGFGGVLLSVGWTHIGTELDTRRLPDEFVYRLDQDGKVLYEFPLPNYTGRLHDEMVLGEKNLGFATRGGMLIAFDVQEGKEIWRWESQTPEIEVFAALANGGCMVQTPAALMEVDGATDAKEVMKAKPQ